MEVLHPRCAGLDVHGDNVVACRRIIRGCVPETEVKTFDTTTRALLKLRAWLLEKGCTHVVMEATGVYWKPVWHALEEGLELILANPAHVKNVPGRKSDVNDAQWLAELLAHGLVRSSFVPERATQERRDLTRTHTQLVREQARHIQRIQKVLEDADIKLADVLSDVTGTSGVAMLKALVAGERDPERLADMAVGVAKNSRAELVLALEGHFREHHGFLLDLHLKQLEAIWDAMTTLEARLGEALEPLREEVNLLKTIPGVGSTGAPVLLAEIGPDMSRFPTVGHLVSWGGFCPRLDESNKKKRNTRTKKGDSWLKTMLVQCAWSAIKPKGSYLHARFQRLKARRGPKKAIMAIAADLLRATYFILKRRVPYKDLGGDFYDRLNTTKATATLVKRLKALGHNVTLSPAS
jgi:transposase